jgi:hypothetical protein
VRRESPVRDTSSERLGESLQRLSIMEGLARPERLENPRVRVRAPPLTSVVVIQG